MVFGLDLSWAPVDGMTVLDRKTPGETLPVSVCSILL